MIRQRNEPADSRTGLSGGRKNCSMGKSDNTKMAQEKRKGFIKKIGNTTYDVSFHYSRQSRESMNDKIIRLIENDMQSRKNN